MATWSQTKSPISERIRQAAVSFKAAIPSLVDRQVGAVTGMAAVIQMAEKGRPK